jgi:VWFA-related protein
MLTWKRVAFWSLATIALLAVAASGESLLGQSSGDASRPAVIAANDPWPEINLNVVVLDKQGAPQTVDVTGFQLFEDGADRPLHFRGSADSPVSVALIVDSSGSIYKRKPEIISAVTTIIKALPADSEVMGVLFADQAFIDLPFTAVSKINYSFLDRLDGRGGTALFDTVVATENYFAVHAKYARRALVLISDGGDNKSSLRGIDAIRRMQWPCAPMFYTLLVHNSGAEYGATERGKRTMELLAKAGGGVAFTPKEKDFLDDATQIAGMIRSQYVLHFASADPARDGKAHKLEVRLPIKDLQIHALPVYYAPAN